VKVAVSGLVVSVLAVGSRFAGSNPGKDDGSLRVIKIRTTTSFRGEVKPLIQCCKLLWHVKEPYEYERDTS
jgi:hypothetical protein